MVSLFLLVVCIAIMAFALGQLFVLQKQATQHSMMAFIAAFCALTEARGLKNSTVIQRIIEKYHPVKQSEELTQAAKEFEEMLQESVMGFPESKKEKEEKKQLQTFNPDELV